MAEAAEDLEPPDGADEAPPTALQEYEFDPADVDVAVELVGVAFAQASNDWEVSSHLTEQAVARGLHRDAPLVTELVFALSYTLRLKESGWAGCNIEPVSRMAERSWPRPILSTDEAVVRLWEGVAAAATCPEAVARFEDLLFSRRRGKGHDRAARAGKAYLDLGAQAEPGRDRVEPLARLDLARSTRNADLDRQARLLIAAEARLVMDARPGELPGVVVPLLAALAEGPVRRKGETPEIDPIDIDEMLREAAGSFRRGHIGTAIALLRRRRTNDPERMRAIARDEVEAYFAEADDAPAGAGAAIRMIHLDRAAQIARDHGLGDLARRAAQEMQRIKPSDLRLQTITTRIERPRYLYEAWLSTFVRSTDWRHAMELFLAEPPPTGPVQALREHERRTRSVLRDLFPPVALHQDGPLRVTATTEADQIASEMANAANIHAQVQGDLLARALWRLKDRYGVPDEDDLTILLSRNGACDAELARGLAKAFRHYWAGDFESCVHVAIPKVEAAARHLLRELDEGIYKAQVGSTLGGYPGLGPLLDELERLALDESWVFFLKWLLLGPFGANARNDVAHGFVCDPGPFYAALVLRAAALLVTSAPSVDLEAGSIDPASRRQAILRTLTSPHRSIARGDGGLVLHVASEGLGKAWWWVERRRAARSAKAAMAWSGVRRTDDGQGTADQPAEV